MAFNYVIDIDTLRDFTKYVCLVLPCLALPCLALLCLALALPCLALPCPCLTLPCLALPYLALPCPCLALPCLGDDRVTSARAMTVIKTNGVGTTADQIKSLEDGYGSRSTTSWDSRRVLVWVTGDARRDMNPLRAVLSWCSGTRILFTSDSILTSKQVLWQYGSGSGSWSIDHSRRSHKFRKSRLGTMTIQWRNSYCLSEESTDAWCWNSWEYVFMIPKSLIESCEQRERDFEIWKTEIAQFLTADSIFCKLTDVCRALDLTEIVRRILSEINVSDRSSRIHDPSINRDKTMRFYWRLWRRIGKIVTNSTWNDGSIQWIPRRQTSWFNFVASDTCRDILQALSRWKQGVWDSYCRRGHSWKKRSWKTRVPSQTRRKQMTWARQRRHFSNGYWRQKENNDIRQQSIPRPRMRTNGRADENPTPDQFVIPWKDLSESDDRNKEQIASRGLPQRYGQRKLTLADEKVVAIVSSKQKILKSRLIIHITEIRREEFVQH